MKFWKEREKRYKKSLMILSETKEDLILILIDNNREEISKIKRELVDHSSISDLLPLSIFPITC
jgi:hypothetical protein